MKIAGDRATIEAAIDDELERTDDINLIAMRVATRLGIDVSACPDIARARAALRASRTHRPASRRLAEEATPGKRTRIAALLERRRASQGEELPRPVDRSQAFCSQLDAFSSLLGQSPPALELEADPRGVAGYHEAGVIHLDQALSPESERGRHVLAHEVVHHAQSRLPGPSFPAAAESEANAIADQLVAGQQAVATVPLSPSRRAAYDERKKEKGPQPTQDEPVIVVGRRAYVLAAWFWKDAVARSSFASGRTKAPTKTPTIIEKLKVAYPWFRAADIAKASENVTWKIRKKRRNAKVLELFLNPSAFQTLGLPPGAGVQWFKNGKGAQLLIRHTLLPEAAGGLSVVIPRPVRERAVEELAAWVGAPVIPMMAERLKEYEQKTSGRAGAKAFRVTYDREQMEAFVGKKAWSAFGEGLMQDAAVAVSRKGGARFTDDVSDADRDYYLQWILLLPRSNRGGWSLPINPAFIRLLREIDADPELKKKVLRAIAGGGRKFGEFNSVTLRSILRKIEIDEKRAEFGLRGRIPRKEGERPLYPWAIRGAIVNRGGLVYQGKRIELRFERESQIGVVAIPRMTVQWFVHLKGDKDKRRQEKVIRYLAHKPKGWTVNLGRSGIYVVHAIVDHEMFEENYFSTEIEVKTKDERQRALNHEAFGHMGRPKTKDHNFDTSWSNEKFGDMDYDIGLAYDAVLPKDYASSGYDSFDVFVRDEIKRMDAVIKHYEGREAHLVKMAKGYRKRLRGMKRDVDRDKKAKFTPFDVNGAFLSNKNGVPSKTLRLLGVARDTRAKVMDKRIGAPVVQVKIHDTSFVTEQKKYEYSGEASTFNGALERAYLDLCKSYPPGRLSMMAEELDKNLLPTGKAKGFELETGTAWKDVKSVVWDPAVQIVVNIAGATVMIFAPVLMPVVFPTLIAYNAIDTIDNLAALEQKGILTRGDAVNAAVMLGLDFLPYLGRLKIVKKYGDVALWGLEAIEIGAQALVLRSEAIDILKKLRDGAVAKVGEAVAERDATKSEIDVRRRRNASDPKLKDLERKLAEQEKKLEGAIAHAQTAGKEAFSSIGEGLAFMVGGGAATKVFGNNMPAGIREAHFPEGSFRHIKGRKPRYNEKTGQVVGDRDKLTPGNIEELKAKQTKGLQEQQDKIAAILGVEPERLVVKRGGKGRAKVTQDGDLLVVTIPHRRKLSAAYGDLRRGKREAAGKANRKERREARALAKRIDRQLKAGTEPPMTDLTRLRREVALGNIKETSLSKAVRGKLPDQTGVNLHDHILGVPDAAYFINKAGGGNPVVALREFVTRAKKDKGVLEDMEGAGDAWRELQEALKKVEGMKGAEARATAKTALEKALKAGDIDFNQSYSTRDSMIKMFSSYEQFMADALVIMKKQGMSYSEQSVSINKLTQRFTPPVMAEAKKRAGADGEGVEIEFLAMIHTRQFTGDAAATKKSQERFDSERKTLKKLMEDGDAMGIDIAGPEKEVFTDQGLERMMLLYDDAKAAAAKRKKPVVLRPHVGEGFAQGAGDHAKIARENLEKLITALERKGINPSKDGVILRFGHAAHASEKQIVRMKKLGVIVEANIGSNHATTSISKDKHPILQMLYHDLDVVLATDGGGVMGTDLGAEYSDVRDLINKFKKPGVTTILNGEPRTYKSLSGNEKKRFSLKRLQKQSALAARRGRSGKKSRDKR